MTFACIVLSVNQNHRDLSNDEVGFRVIAQPVLIRREFISTDLVPTLLLIFCRFFVQSLRVSPHLFLMIYELPLCRGMTEIDVANSNVDKTCRFERSVEIP